MAAGNLPAPSPGTLSQIRQYTQGVKDAMARQDVTTMNTLADRYVDITRVVQGRIQALAQEVADQQEAGDVVSAGRLAALDNWQNLQIQLAQEFAKYVDWASPKIGADAAARMALGTQTAAEQLALLGPGGALQAAAMQTFPTEALQQVTMNTAGGPLADLLARSYAPMEQTIALRLVEGVLNGVPVADIAQDCADATGLGLDRIFTVARTEESRAYRDGALNGYRQSGIVHQYVRLSARDDYVCIGCLVADGDVSDTDQFDAHPNCRCTMLPVIDGEDPADVGQDQDSESWFNDQSQATQDAIAGPGANAWYQTYQDQDVNGISAWDSLAQRTVDDTWGGSITGTPLYALQDGGGGIPEGWAPTPPPDGSGSFPSGPPDNAGVMIEPGSGLEAAINAAAGSARHRYGGC